MNAGPVKATNFTAQQLSTLSPEELHAVKDVCRYYSMQQAARSSGSLNIFLGLLTLVLGLENARQSWMGVVQTLLGLLITGQSLWAVAGPSVTAILTWSILFAICGVWNLIVCVLLGLNVTGIVIGGLGILQVFWAVRYYSKYRKYRQMTLVVPTAETAALHKKVWSSVATAAFSKDNDVVEYRVNQRILRGMLLPTAGVFAVDGRRLIMLADKQEVAFTPNNPGSTKGAVAGRLKVDGRMMPVVFDQISFQKYNEWKATA